MCNLPHSLCFTVDTPPQAPYKINMRFLSILFAMMVALCAAPLPAATASTELLKRAHHGDVTAMRRLGIRLYEGHTAPKNIPGAIAWWERAAARGDARSLVYLGDMHRQGIYYTQNLQKAAKFYLLAAARGDTVAQKHLDLLPPEYRNAAPPPCPRTPPTRSCRTGRCPSPSAAPAAGPAPNPPFLDEMNARLRSNLPLVFEHELILEDTPEVPYRTQMRDFAQDLYKKHNGHRDKIMHELHKGAAFGVRRYDGAYIVQNHINLKGPLFQCLYKAAEHIQFCGIEGASNDIDDISFCHLTHQWDRTPCHGTYSDYNGRKFHYAVTIIPDQDGLPYIVKVRLDFTPGKANIIKK